MTYRCINSDCGRSFPRQVNFCPFCGTRQAAATARRPGTAAAAGQSSAAPTIAPNAAPTVAPTAPPPRRPANVGKQAAASGIKPERYAPQDLPPEIELDSAPEDNAPAMTPEQIATLQARLNRARGVSPDADADAATPNAAAAGTAAAAATGTAKGGRPAVAQASTAGGAVGTAGMGGKPPPPGAARPQATPPLREPIGLGTWLLVAMILAVIWYLAKPANKEERIAARVEQAEKLTVECKLDDARAELASLRADKAPAAQIRRVNDAITGAVLGCEKKRQRAKAWAELKPVLENAVERSPQAGALDNADSRLAAFARKWGADDDTRDWDKRIDGKKAERLLDEADACLQRADRACLEAKLLAAERYKRPELEERIRTLRESLSRLLEATVLEQKAPPAIANDPPRGVPPPLVITTSPQTAQASQQARKILADAERELSQGNYKGAMDKAEICATMIDVGNRECLGLKQRAERLNRDMLRCVASGADWINDRCQP
ncbi:hypothetical protein [Pseudoduganella sp. UC29_71]|uniref:hypothetical protein n=1 Tax=Pseudoduganella sp. UC29_71 TaxID=3350174 RepID=UPI0036723028